VPRRLGGFELIEKIGRGGMGSVFKAHQVDLDRTVAVKVLSPRLARNDEFVEQFLREARSAGRLNHPNIVAAIDVGESDGVYYFAMEYVDGETLAQELKRQGPLPEERAIAIAVEVAKALDAAHQRGLIHRDIKPDNIMLARDGRVRVTDFGLARMVDPDGRPTTDSSRFIGTPAYMAPEQVKGQPDVDCRADIFSLGVTLFQMLTGERPFTGPNTVSLAAAVITEPLPSIRQRRPDVSLAICRVVEKMTAKDPAERYATPADVIAALQQAASAPKLRGRAPAAQRRPAPRRRKSSSAGLVIAVAAVVAGLIVLGLILSEQGRSPQPPPQPRTKSPPRTKTPTPEPGPPTPAATPGEELFGRLQAAMANAERYAQEHPKAYASQLERYRQILNDFPPDQQVYLPREGIQLIEQASERIQSIRDQAKQAAETELQRRRQRAKALLDAGRVPQALRLFDTFPTELKTPAVEAELAAERQKFLEQLATLYESIDQQAEALAKEETYDQAIALYRGVMDWGLREFTERAEVGIAEIEDLMAERDTELARQARRAWPKHARRILELLHQRQYDAAEDAVAAARVDPELEPVREKFGELGEITRAAKQILARAETGAKQHEPGDTLRVGGVAGSFVRVHEGKIFLKVRAGSDTAHVAKPLRELRAQELVDLALKTYGEDQSPAVVPVALFLLADDKPDAARRGLEAAQDRGEDVAHALDLVRRYGSRPCPRCEGDKDIPCPRCGGTGGVNVRHINCPDCRGRGWNRCTKCGGRGDLVCPICKGRGQAFRGIACAHCNGTGRVDCPACRAGKVRCKKCDGTGTLTRAEPCPRCQGKKQVPCPTCGGQGRLPPLEVIRPAARKQAKTDAAAPDREPSEEPGPREKRPE
jgi:serine/threonine-protein kinase